MADPHQTSRKRCGGAAVLRRCCWPPTHLSALARGAGASWTLLQSRGWIHSAWPNSAGPARRPRAGWRTGSSRPSCSTGSAWPARRAWLRPGRTSGCCRTMPGASRRRAWSAPTSSSRWVARRAGQPPSPQGPVVPPVPQQPGPHVEAGTAASSWRAQTGCPGRRLGGGRLQEGAGPGLPHAGPVQPGLDAQRALHACRRQEGPPGAAGLAASPALCRVAGALPRGLQPRQAGRRLAPPCARTRCQCTAVCTVLPPEGLTGHDPQVRETVRDVVMLHNESFFAAAQKKYAYIYDKHGLEVHCLRVRPGQGCIVSHGRQRTPAALHSGSAQARHCPAEGA